MKFSSLFVNFFVFFSIFAQKIMDRRQFLRTGSLASLSFTFVPAILPKSLVDTDKERSDMFAAFVKPPVETNPGGYWWWLNGLIDKEGITRDITEFAAKGVNNLLLVNSIGSEMPEGVKFLSDEWKVLFRHALGEAKKHGISIGMNLCSGWCMGGPWITPEMGGRWFLQSETVVQGGKPFTGKLPLPGNRSGYDDVFNPPGFRDYIDLPLEQLDYRDTAVTAFKKPTGNVAIADKALLTAKSNRRDASNWATARNIMQPLEQPLESSHDCSLVAPEAVIDLTDRLKPDGTLEWDVPEGEWIVIRTGHRMTGSRLSIAQKEADGLSVAWLNSMGLEKQFEKLGKPVLEEARKAGYKLDFFCDDSFEDGFPNWTKDIRVQFVKYRGYDPVPYFPIFAGYMVGSAEISDRFLNDYRKTIADCMADRHYGRFAELCHENGLKVQNESAGPSRSGTMCMDVLKNLGRSDYPCGEFWLGVKHDEPGGLDKSYGESRLEMGHNKVTKAVASAAHLYGKKTASAEAFTSYRHWLDCPATLKQATDRAFCEGINRLLCHTMTASRPRDGKPGYEYYAGTHFNPNITWWEKAGDFFAYISRCQYMLQQGLFVADVLFYNGDTAPNIVEPKHLMPSLGDGYDYDVCNEEILLTRLSVKDGMLVTPEGMSYRLLVLPDKLTMPVATLEKIASFVEQGATIVGEPPVSDSGLKDYPLCDTKVKQIAAKLWGQSEFRGRVFTNKDVRKILQDDGIVPDFEATSSIDFIHRRTDDCDCWFIANLTNQPVEADCSFRITGRCPELWDPVRAKKRAVTDYKSTEKQTVIPISFAPFQSFFAVFPKNASGKPANGMKNFPALQTLMTLYGAWQVSFDPAMGVPKEVVFPKLTDWTQSEDDGIKYYSGKGVYKTTFSLNSKPDGRPLFLSLGVVKDIAEVRLNGRSLGVVWTAPWQVEITSAVRQKNNLLEVEVINEWANRLIGDANLPPEQRVTNTNIKVKADAPLRASGLLGPITILKQL